MGEQPLLSVNGDTHISGGQFVVNNYQVPSSSSQTSSGFDRLHSKTAVTAFHDALGSFESGKCHPNTRQAVLDDLSHFIEEDAKTRKKWIIWLSGPAGSGKTTISRTLAYLCGEKGFDQASFFFCRLDFSRNSIKSLVATLAYQIACRFQIVKARIVAEVERRPHIFELSVEEQFHSLITLPLNDSGWKSDSAMYPPRPIVCVVDALDECDGQHAQSYLVETLHKLVAEKDTPVVFMIASRPEPNLRMSFNRIRNSILRIYLDNSYDPSADIRRFVVDKFEEIRMYHPLAASLPRDWPKPSVIDAIVTKSSGQFLYAATVVQYVSTPAADPETNLDSIFNSPSMESSCMPFAELDQLFTFILRQATNKTALLTTMTCHLLSRELSNIWFPLLLESFGLSVKSIQRHLLDVTSLVEMDDKDQRLIIHNESLIDFLIDRQRSGYLHIDLGSASSEILVKILHQRTPDDVYLIVDYIIALLLKVTDCSPELAALLLGFTRETVTGYPECFLTVYGSEVLESAFSNPRIDIKYRREWNGIWSGWLARPVRAITRTRKTKRTAQSQKGAYFGSLMGRPRRNVSMVEPKPSRNVKGLHDLEHILAAIWISDKTKISFTIVAGLLGYNSVNCARVVTLFPSMLAYDSTKDTVSTLYEWTTICNELGLERIPDKFMFQTLIGMLSLSHSYRGNLFGDLSALLFAMRFDMQAIMEQRDQFTHAIHEFATGLLGSPQIDVHVLDFTTFLDGLSRAAQCNWQRPISRLSKSLGEASSEHRDDPYIEILTVLVKFWASKHQQLDPQLLSIPKFRDLWQTIV